MSDQPIESRDRGEPAGEESSAGANRVQPESGHSPAGRRSAGGLVRVALLTVTVLGICVGLWARIAGRSEPEGTAVRVEVRQAGRYGAAAVTVNAQRTNSDAHLVEQFLDALGQSPSSQVVFVVGGGVRWNEFERVHRLVTDNVPDNLRITSTIRLESDELPPLPAVAD